MRLSTIGQMASLLAHSTLVHSLGPSACTPAPGSSVTPALINQVIVGMAPVMFARVDPSKLFQFTSFDHIITY